MLGENFGKKVIEWLQQDQGLIKRAGDNIDINQSARNQRKDNHGKSSSLVSGYGFQKSCSILSFA